MSFPIEPGAIVVFLCFVTRILLAIEFALSISLVVLVPSKEHVALTSEVPSLALLLALFPGAVVLVTARARHDARARHLTIDKPTFIGIAIRKNKLASTMR